MWGVVLDNGKQILKKPDQVDRLGFNKCL